MVWRIWKVLRLQEETGPALVNNLPKGVFRVNAVLQKYLAKGKLFARIFAKPYQDEDGLRTRFDL